MFNKRRICW